MTYLGGVGRGYVSLNNDLSWWCRLRGYVSLNNDLSWWCRPRGYVSMNNDCLLIHF